MSAAPEKIKNPLHFLRRKAEEGSADFHGLVSTAEKAALSVLTGHHPHRKAGTGEKFWQFRNYDPGDRPQDIDWRQSGKGDNIFVRQKELQTRQTILVWCAGGHGMDYSSGPQTRSKKTVAAALALAAAILGMRGEDSVGLLDKSIPAGRTGQTLDSIALNCMNGSHGTLPPVTTFPQNVGVILLGDFLEPVEKIETAFASIASRTANGIVMQILDPAELSLPFSGRVLFRQPDSKTDIAVPNVAPIRDVYRQKIEAHIQAVAAICSRYRWRHVLHVTNRPLVETLMKVAG